MGFIPGRPVGKTKMATAVSPEAFTPFPSCEVLRSTEGRAYICTRGSRHAVVQNPPWIYLIQPLYQHTQTWHRPGPCIPRTRDQQGFPNPQNLTPPVPQTLSLGHHLSGTETPPTQITQILRSTRPQLHPRCCNRSQNLRIWKCHQRRAERNPIHSHPMSYDPPRPKDTG